MPAKPDAMEQLRALSSSGKSCSTSGCTEDSAVTVEIRVREKGQNGAQVAQASTSKCADHALEMFLKVKDELVA